MEALIKIQTDENLDRFVSGRELHSFLEVGTEYSKWMQRMCEYGFTEGVDFNSVKFDGVRIEGEREVKRTLVNHLMTIGYINGMMADEELIK